jgi:Leucine-rich repeat (LRR) protein
VERQLAKLTHLPMDSRGLTKIANLKACTSVRVIYLYDNKIRRIENLSFAQHCTHLYLQNNELTDLGDLHGLKKLQKLYLDGNLIACASHPQSQRQDFVQLLHLSN